MSHSVPGNTLARFFAKGTWATRRAGGRLHQPAGFRHGCWLLWTAGEGGDAKKCSPHSEGAVGGEYDATIANTGNLYRALQQTHNYNSWPPISLGVLTK